MNSVNDLNRTNKDITNGPPTQTVSLDAVRRPNQNTTRVNINTTNGLSGVSNETNNTNTIKISPNIMKKPRRTVKDPSEIQEINPNDYIEKPKEESKDFVRTIQSNAMSQLDAAVRRKRQEFQDFVDYAEKADKLNRERIENGLEEVEGEINYLPNDIPQSITKDPNPKKEVEKINTEPEIDEVEKDLEKELASDDITNSNVRINSDPFGFDMNFTNTYSNHINDSIDNTIPDGYDGNFNEEDNVEDPDYDEGEDYLDKEDTEIISYNDENNLNREDQVFSDEEYKEEDTPVEEVEIVVEEAKEEEPVSAVIEKKDEEIRNNLIDGAISVSSQVNYDVENTKANIKNSTSSDFDIDEKDFEDVEDNDTAAQTEEDAVALSQEEITSIRKAGEKNLRNEILQKVINIGKKYDTTQFTVSKKVISIKDATKNIPTPITRTASWPMMYAERPFIASALKGPEIALLLDYDDSDSDSSIGITQNQLKIMYEHDANKYKPNTIENWAKTIPFLDIESIFAALYVASMKGANYFPMTCRDQKCQNQFLTDNTEISKVVKFSNDNIKKKFEEIQKVQITEENTRHYDTVVSVINDNFAIGLKIPSIFTMVYELNSVNREFVEKYSTVISIIQYIDYIYKINPDTMSFEPIGWKAYVGDYGKTFKSKIATYAKILKEFESTEFSILIALINSMLTKATEIKALEYEVPACKCPKCGSEITAIPLAPRQLLFMRQRLVELATTPTER